MRHGKHGLRAFGVVIVAALGLMAFMAAGAQANWLYLEGSTNVEIAANEKVKVTTHREFNLLLSNGIEIKCAAITDEDLLLVGKSSEATGELLFSACHTFLKGVAESACDPIGQPIEAPVKAQLILSSSKNFILVEPISGMFWTIEFGLKCALIETDDVTGSLVMECGLLSGGSFFGEDCANHQVSHLLQQARAEAFNVDQLKFGELKASLDGIAAIELAGAHPNHSWSGTI